MTLKYPNYEHY